MLITGAKLVGIEAIRPIAHDVILHQHRGCLEKIAHQLDASYTTLYSQLAYTKSRSIDFDMLRLAESITASPVLGDLLVYPGRRISADAAPISRDADPATEAAESMESTAALCAYLRQALADGRISPNELNEIIALAETARAELDDLVALAKAKAGKTPACTGPAATGQGG